LSGYVTLVVTTAIVGVGMGIVLGRHRRAGFAVAMTGLAAVVATLPIFVVARTLTILDTCATPSQWSCMDGSRSFTSDAGPLIRTLFVLVLFGASLGSLLGSLAHRFTISGRSIQRPSPESPRSPAGGRRWFTMVALVPLVLAGVVPAGAGLARLPT